MSTEETGDFGQGLTPMKKLFCEIHARESSAGKAWNEARFLLGIPRQDDKVARAHACRAKKEPEVAAYLKQINDLVARLFPTGIPEPEEPSKHFNPNPNRYKPEYCDAVRKWFNVPHFKEVETTITTRTGNTIVKKEMQPVPPPHMGAFARSIGVSKAALDGWAQKYPEFAAAYQEAKDMLAEHLIDGGLLGTFNSHFGRFVAVNLTEMRDRTAVDVTSEGRALAPTVSVVPPSQPEPEPKQKGDG